MENNDRYNELQEIIKRCEKMILEEDKNLEIEKRTDNNSGIDLKEE